MIRKKIKVKGNTFDKFHNLVDCETEIEKITAESVGDILDLLSSCSRGATVFMVPPAKGDTIQRVQVFDCCRRELSIGGYPTSAIGFRKAFSFVIGGHGPYDMLECYEKQIQREKDKKQIVLSEEQTAEIADKFFKDVYYANGDNYISIDGHVTIDTILKAADHIRQMTSQT